MKLNSTMLDRVFYLLADAPSDEAILAFYVTPEEEKRLAELAAISKQRTLNQQEQQEFDLFRQVSNYVRYAKAQALMRMNGLAEVK